MGICEKLHKALRRIFNKGKTFFLTVNSNTLFRVALEEMNDMIRVNGLFSSKIVFGIMPRLPIIYLDLPKLKVVTEVFVKAKMEMNLIV